MTISRKIIFLVLSALLTSVIIFCVAFFGFSGIETEVGHLASKVAADNEDILSIREALSSARSWMIGILAVALMLLSALGFMLMRSIVKPLKDMESAISKTADQLDFTEIIQVDSDDEIGNTLKTYNRLLTRLRGSFIESQTSIANLMEVTEEVDRSSRKIARNSTLQSDASSNMASAVEEMTVSISMVADQAADASKHTEKSRQIAENSAGIILTTVNCIKLISETVGEAATRIKALRADCDSISSMAKIIREIADQTNLLALNAAIEAARAGEQGRGFAVVADEVRKLAERTTLSTQEISDLLKRMQESSRLAVDSMTRTEKAVDDGVVHARQAGESIEQIKTGADAAAIVVSDISSAMREQEAASAAISRNIEQIAQMSEQNSAAAGTSAASAGRMTEFAAGMTQALSAYKVETGVKKIVLRCSDIYNPSHPAVRATQVMSDYLNQTTQGRITLKVFAEGQMGQDVETLENVKKGTLDMVRTNSAFLIKDCPLLILPGLPFMFNSVEHKERALDGAPGQEITASLESSGLVCLAFYEAGARCFYTNSPIRSVADMRDLKIRSMPSDLWLAIISAFGSRPVPLPQDQVIHALKSGLIDAAENSLLNFMGQKHVGHFKYYNITDHSLSPEMLVFSKKKWDTLTPEDQAIIRQAGKEAVTAQRRFLRESEDVARKDAMAAGTIFNKDVDRGSFERVIRPVYDKFITSQQQKSVMQAIKSIR